VHQEGGGLLWDSALEAPLKEPADKSKMFRTLLKGQALYYFESHLRRRLETEDSEIPDNELIEIVLRELYIGLENFPKLATGVKKHYMRQIRDIYIYMGLNKSVQKYFESLEWPQPLANVFSWRSPQRVRSRWHDWNFNQAKARDPKWHEAMVNTNIENFEMYYEGSVSYFKNFENLKNIKRTNGPSPTSLLEDNRHKQISYQYCRRIYWHT
jgi:hypothetical protein